MSLQGLSPKPEPWGAAQPQTRCRCCWRFLESVRWQALLTPIMNRCSSVPPQVAVDVEAVAEEDVAEVQAVAVEAAEAEVAGEAAVGAAEADRELPGSRNP